MPRPRAQVPSYLHHKPTNRAYVRLRNPDGSRQTVYLGEYNSPESRKEYARILAGTLPVSDSPAECLQPAANASVAELLLAYHKHAEDYYRDRQTGRMSDYMVTVNLSIRALRSLYANLPVAEFRPRHLVAVRDSMVSSGLSRKEVNRRIGVIKRAFKWAMGADLAPPDVFQRLAAVEGLRAGRTAAPERDRIKPANPEHVAAAVEHLPPTVAAIVLLQRLTGARCGELCRLRPVDLDRSDPAIWVYRPNAHKGTWRGKDRVILIGSNGQTILCPLLEKCAADTEHVFSPAKSERERNAARGEARKTSKWPSHMQRNKAKRVGKQRVRPPRARYDTASVRQAVERACEKAKVPLWTPHQLRHLAAHEIRSRYGIDVARAVLGHTMAAMSEHYSKDVDLQLAKKAAAEIG